MTIPASNVFFLCNFRKSKNYAENHIMVKIPSQGNISSRCGMSGEIIWSRSCKMFRYQGKAESEFSP